MVATPRPPKKNSDARFGRTSKTWNLPPTDPPEYCTCLFTASTLISALVTNLFLRIGEFSMQVLCIVEMAKVVALLQLCGVSKSDNGTLQARMFGFVGGDLFLFLSPLPRKKNFKPNRCIKCCLMFALFVSVFSQLKGISFWWDSRWLPGSATCSYGAFFLFLIRTTEWDFQQKRLIKCLVFVPWFPSSLTRVGFHSCWIQDGWHVRRPAPLGLQLLQIVVGIVDSWWVGVGLSFGEQHVFSLRNILLSSSKGR